MLIVEIIDDFTEFITGVRPQRERERARTKSGRYRADNKLTKDIDEAWINPWTKR